VARTPAYRGEQLILNPGIARKDAKAQRKNSVCKKVKRKLGDFAPLRETLGIARKDAKAQRKNSVCKKVKDSLATLRLCVNY
jgi:hypothetical protein